MEALIDTADGRGMVIVVWGEGTDVRTICVGDNVGSGEVIFLDWSGIDEVSMEIVDSGCPGVEPSLDAAGRLTERAVADEGGLNGRVVQGCKGAERSAGHLFVTIFT